MLKCFVGFKEVAESVVLLYVCYQLVNGCETESRHRGLLAYLTGTVHWRTKHTEIVCRERGGEWAKGLGWGGMRVWVATALWGSYYFDFIGLLKSGSSGEWYFSNK